MKGVGRGTAKRNKQKKRAKNESRRWRDLKHQKGDKVRGKMRKSRIQQREKKEEEGSGEMRKDKEWSLGGLGIAEGRKEGKEGREGRNASREEGETRNNRRKRKRVRGGRKVRKE